MTRRFVPTIRIAERVPVCHCSWCDPPCNNDVLIEGDEMCGQCSDGDHEPRPR